MGHKTGGLAGAGKLIAEVASGGGDRMVDSGGRNRFLGGGGGDTS